MFYGYTPLHEASRHGHVEVVKELLRHPKIDSTIKHNDGYTTPLHLASLNGHVEVVKQLLHHHAAAKIDDVNVVQADGYTPLH